MILGESEMKESETDLLFSRNAKFLRKNGQVVAMNRLCGNWIRFSEECYEYLQQAIELGLSKEEFLNCIEEDDDKSYMNKLIRNLENIKVIINFSDREKECEPNLETVQIMLTNRCNLKCKHCATNATSVNDSDYLTTEDIK